MEAVRHVHDKMMFEDAEQRLQGRLPEDVAALLRVRHGKATPTFSEDSLQKARKILNSMVFKSFAELDNGIIDCKEFERSNRGTYEQVVTDLARLGSEIAAEDEKITENYQCVGARDAEFKEVKGTHREAKRAYKKELAEDEAEMQLKKNDLAVFNFIMDLTKCADSTAFVQVGSSVEPMKVCETSEGFSLDFSDPKLQAEAKRIMTPGARAAIREALGLAFAGKHMSLLQTRTGNLTTGAPPLTLEPVSVQEEPSPQGQWKKCTDGKPNCGLLHDTMSLQWGKFKDLVDELQAEMDRKEDEWETLKANLNEQLTVIGNQKGKCQTAFDAATGAKNTLTEENNEKDSEKHDLTVAYDAKMATCKARIEELLFTDVCAVRKVRNELMKSSTTSKPDQITDCDVKDWVAEQCSVPCDDRCPHPTDPYACGGWQTLNRAVIVQNNSFGIACPLLTRKTRCGQFKCSVDCVQSRWSGWSKCTKECEGGAEQQTRSILVKPKHGGQSCDASVETRACNTMSCDRDCTLEDWTSWSPCSMACNPGGMPGFQERVRKVLVPIRGEGKCPNEESVDRYEKQTCNDHPCAGDEVCIAKQDLIIALDASGSLKESGFEILRDFAANLTGKYMAEYFGAQTVQLGAILFGNGARLPDGTIAPATNLVGLTSDLALVKEKLEAATWQKGFTNMAQAFVLADTMFQQGGRPDAQSSILVLSDGKYSFAFETEQAANKLKEKNTMIYMAPVNNA